MSDEARAPETTGPAAPLCSLGELARYFLRIGAVGFGGPIALAGYMQRDLVEERRWFTEADYKEGLALSQLSPGPLAAQLAMYLGWVRAGTVGALLIGGVFVLPSFVMVLILAAFYVRYGGLPWMAGAFYGIGAGVIAIIARSAAKLAKMTLKKDPLLWVIFAIVAIVTAVTAKEIVWLFLAGGLVALLVRAPPRLGAGASVLALPPIFVTGLHGAASTNTLVQIAWYFTKAGAFIFGSGLAIVPFLYDGVVQRFHWLDDRQFLDAVAVAMITPGPVVITAGFIGFLAAGLLGAMLAAVGTFLPPFLVVVIAARPLRRATRNASAKAFVAGVTSAAAGAIAGAAFVLGRRAIVDVSTALIALAVLGALMASKKIPEPILIVASGVAGLVLKTMLRQ
ncbi:Chromate transport protein ChrA [Minicystis rosea]|nr:Chromate transport protein ChrA [Minicystis rosea]